MIKVKSLFKKLFGKRWEDRPLWFQLFCSLMLCICIMLCINWLVNNLALGKYYQYRKRKNLENMFQQVNTLVEQNTEDYIIRLSLDRLNSVGNYRTALVNTRGEILYFSVCGVNVTSGTASEPFISYQTDLLSMQVGEHTFEVLQDSRLNQNNLVLVGKLSNQICLIVNTPLDSIRESTEITNRFLLFTGLLTILLSAAVVILITQTFTKSIHRLSEITDKISHLDFSAHFDEENENEIGRLGKSINRLSTELERNISELRTANLHLIQDNQMKTKQAETRRQFISNVSHELKTPIALILAYSEGLLENVSQDAEERKYYCETIHDEAENMGQLIKKMISLMQLESGEEELSISQFSINNAITSVLRRYNILLEEKNIGVDYFVSEEYFVWGDAFFIENVLNNYLSNACNHVSPKGEIRISVCPIEAEALSHIRVEVFNTGDNIPEEALEHIWESFYKVDKARSRSYGGTGIGLSVVAAIMKSHEMPYGVRNEPNGVTFWFELDRANQ